MVVHHFKDDQCINGSPVEPTVSLQGGWLAPGPDDQSELLVEPTRKLTASVARQFFPLAGQVPDRFHVRSSSKIIQSLGQFVGRRLLKGALACGLVFAPLLETAVDELDFHSFTPEVNECNANQAPMARPAQKNTSVPQHWQSKQALHRDR